MKKIIITLIAATLLSATTVAPVFAHGYYGRGGVAIDPLWPVTAALAIPAAILGTVANAITPEPVYVPPAPVYSGPATYYAPRGYYAPRPYYAPRGYYAPRPYYAPRTYYPHRYYYAPRYYRSYGW